MREKKYKPKFLRLSDSEFLAKIEKGRSILQRCTLCGNMCRVNRVVGELGICRIGSQPKVSSFNVHCGEEPPISGTKGSGTVFMTGCCLECVFCQNYPISQYGHGVIMGYEDFAGKMLKLEKKGVHNLNFVAPTHQAPQIIEGIYGARKRGLKIPIVYNTGGYDSADCLDLLDGVVDIYLPDFKYADDKAARKISGAKNYVSVAKTAVAQMHRQAGKLKCAPDGVGRCGLLVRHLILPEGRAQTEKVFKILRDILPLDTCISVMGQYFPAYRAKEVDLGGVVSPEEYDKAVEDVMGLGFTNIFKQEIDKDTDAFAVKKKVL